MKRGNYNVFNHMGRNFRYNPKNNSSNKQRMLTDKLAEKLFKNNEL